MKYGLINYRTYNVIYGTVINNVLIWEENEKLHAIIFRDANLTNIEKMKKEYKNAILVEGGNISNSCIYEDNTIDINNRIVKFQNNTIVNFYSTETNSFENAKGRFEDNFLHEFHLRNVDKEWNKLKKLCEEKHITPKQIKDFLDI